MYPYYPYLSSEKVCKEIPISFVKQHQECQPGLEFEMNPKPISIRPDYVGSGKLKGKVAIITGGDSGIGRAIAYLFGLEGAKVVIVYLCEDKDAIETRDMIENMGGECLAIAGDLTNSCVSKEVVARTLERFGQIDILVNNCAVQFIQRSLLDITDEQLELTFKTNIFSYFYMTKAVLPYLKGGSSIINTTSVTAYQGNKDLLDYSATKGAITTFTRSLSASLVDKGIRVNGVAPGPIWTPLIPASYSAEEVSTFGTLTSHVPMNRAGQPFEVATSYLFLASEDSNYMTGQILHPNGGVITGT